MLYNEGMHPREGVVGDMNNLKTFFLLMVNPLKGGTVANLFSTHPPIQERVKRLRQMRPY